LCSPSLSGVQSNCGAFSANDEIPDRAWESDALTPEQNKTTVWRFFDASGSAFESAVNELVSDDCEVANVVSSARGRQAFFQSRDALQAAFSNLSITVQDIVADADQVVVRLLWSGIHRGRFLGVDPTGKSAQWTVVVFLRLSNGQIASWWSLVDRFAILQQITGQGGPS
jgi:predicted ester cyclase